MEMCQRRETDLANTVVTSLRRESDVKAQLQSCEDREKLLNVKLQQYEEGHAQNADLQNMQNQIKEVSRNLSFCQEEIQQCKTQGQKTGNEKNKLQESLKQCAQSLQQLTTGQQTIIRILGESRDELKQEIITPKASLNELECCPKVLQVERNGFGLY
ncbi:hypothetical protein B566_EDAN007010 [Ephemera danica]|nr:hypothetical protein B566_EDAN007010 [Ephemera danica]